MTTRPPTPRQLEVLGHIRDHARTHGYPPSVRELAQIIGVTSTHAVFCHLNALEAKQLIDRSTRTSRGLRITTQGKRWLTRREA